MQIRGKVTVLLALLFTVLIVAQWQIEQHQVLPRFVALERDSARTDMQRVAMALQREQQSLMTRTGDWANWYDLWQYAGGHNPKFARANLTNDAFVSTHVDYLAVVSRNGHILWKHGPISESGQTIALRINKDDQLEPAWQQAISRDERVSGLVATDRGVLITAACPILDGSGHSEPHGIVVMGWLLNAAELQRLGTQAQVELDMRLWRDQPVGNARVASAPASGQSLITETSTATRIERSFANLSGVPLVVMGIRIPRAISHQGSDAVRYSMQMLAGAAAIVLLALFLILRRTVLDPLSRVIRHAQRIAKSNDLSARLREARRDEIGALARVFDDMLERLDDSRRELAARSFESGVAENARGILHNLGNAMTPLSVNIDGIRESLDGIPVNDILSALDELRLNAGDDPERRRDLEQFVRLGAFQAAHALLEFGTRLDGVAEQTQVVQAVLAEQRRHQQGDPVRQSITPAELVARSLRQISPVFRDRLEVQLTSDLAAEATLWLPSTTLGMVIANLAQNSAEAANQSGLERVRLRFDVSIVATAMGDALKLIVSDDGPGVSADQMTHLFQKGYSTKPHASNSGLGLHWCANTMRAMGGSICARDNASGPGLQFEIQVPLQEDLRTNERAA
jgi:sensor domain CHASE-containing protein